MTQKTPAESKKDRIYDQHYRAEKRIWKTAGAVILASVLASIGSCGKSINDSVTNPYKDSPQVTYCTGLQRAVTNLHETEHTIMSRGDIYTTFDKETEKLLQEQKQNLSRAKEGLSQKLAIAEKDPVFVAYQESTANSDLLGHLGFGILVGGVILGLCGAYCGDNLNDKIKVYRLRRVAHNNPAVK